jgi:hypothetical protein
VKKKPAPEKPRKRLPPVVDRKKIFLEAIADVGYISHAAKLAKIDRGTHRFWLKNDPEYPARFREALALATDLAEDRMRQLALEGVFEPNVFQGRFVYPQIEVEIAPAVLDRKGRTISPAVTEWRDKPNARPLGIWRQSERMIAMWLRAWKPERYRNAVEVSGPEGGPIEIVERLNAGRARIAALKDAPK